MAKRDLSLVDASSHASEELEQILRRTSAEVGAPQISVEEALSQPRLVVPDGTRDITRVLFISQDTSLLNPEKQSLDGFVSLADLFEEVHLLVLRTGIKPLDPVLRVKPNVWIYTAAAKFWFLTPKAALDLAEEQLVFAAGFRPDLIVARDPFESAIVARNLARRFERPAQLHVLDDYTTADFIKKSPHNWWRRFLPRFTIKSFVSARAATGSIERLLARRFTIRDLGILPRYHSYSSIINAPATLDLKEKYKPFIFIMLFIGKLTHDSTLYRAIDAARFALRNPRVGLVVLGDGPAKAEFQKRTRIHGIEKQVVFDSRVADVVPYLKSAHMLIATDTDIDCDEMILQGAAAGIPLVMSRTEKREDLFEHGVSAYLCEETDTQGFADRISDLLNNVGMRRVFKDNAQAMIEQRFHQNIEEYRESYRASIEHALFVSSDEPESQVKQ